MPYEVKEAPLPVKGASRRKLWSEERTALDGLEVGDTYLHIPDVSKLNAVRCACTALAPKKFSVRKLENGEGWGVWRLR